MTWVVVNTSILLCVRLLLACLCQRDVLILLAPTGTASLQTQDQQHENSFSCGAEEGGSPVHTSELRGEQQSLEQRVQVARPSLVLNAAQIAPSSWRRWLIALFDSSYFGGG